jgi:DnaJ domain.
MKPKAYEKKYLGNFNLLNIVEDLAEDFRDYLKLHEGKMTTIRFRNGAKEIFEKIKNIARRIELDDQAHQNLAKYFYARILMPSYRIYWRKDDDYYRASAFEAEAISMATATKAMAASKATEDLKNKYRPGSVVKPQHFSNYENKSGSYYCGGAGYYRASDWHYRSFYAFLKEGIKVCFNIEQDVVLSDYTKEQVEEMNAQSKLRGFPRKVIEAAEFLGLLDSIEELTLEQIKSQYRALSKIHHPDLGGSAESFIQLTGYVDQLTDYIRLA